MLDYVRKAHDIEIRPSSVASITSEPIARISFKFWLLVTLGHMPGSFFIFFFSILEKKCGIFYKYFSISLRWDPMGVKLLLPLQNRSRKFSYFSWIFFSMVLTKLYIWNFGNGNLTIFFSLKWDPMGVKISKRYSYKLQPNVFKLAPNFPLIGPHKIMLESFEILSF